MIKATNISYSHGEKPLYSESSFTIGKNAKVAIVGQNGAGKSTLLQLFCGKIKPDTGKLVVQGEIGYVPQEVKSDELLQTSIDVRTYIDPAKKKSDFELSKMLAGVELTNLDLTDKPAQMSGGQKTKLALLRALIAEPDILLLDEPTNFLDTAGKKWVMHFLASYKHTLVVISHDLELLDKYIEKVVAIDITLKKIEEFQTNYSSYVRLKKERDQKTKRDIITQQRQLKHMKKGLERMDRFTSDKGVRQRTQLKKRIQKIQENMPDLPREVARINFKLPEPAWVGEVPIMAKGICKSYGNDEILSDVSLTIKRGERIVLLGPNGAGKSTFIKTLVGLVQPDRGEIVRDEKLTFGYYSQEFEAFDESKTLLATISDISKLPENNTRPLLARFLFGADKVHQKISTLSGGEKTRLQIAILLLQKNNMLFLDEPTTYLDMLSQRLILDAIKSYKGTVLLVSHTPEFVKEFKPDKALLLPENELRIWDDSLLNKVEEM